jgi:alpha,alpha-trehalase
VDGNDLGPLCLEGKLAPDVFLHAARRLGVEPSQAIVVEDAISGVQAAREGRLDLVVGVAREHEANDLCKAGAEVVLQELRELQSVEQYQSGQDQLRPPPASVLENVDEIASRLKRRKVVLFLDYDGVLTPIVRRPEEAILSNEMRFLLHQLAGRCTVAIVSGRDRQDAEDMVQVENLVYAGSHGFDIRGPKGLAMQHEDAKKLLPELDEAERQLRQRITGVTGAHLERKRFAIAVHYREVANEHDVKYVEKIVDEVRQEYPGLRKKGGKKVFELQPDVEWDKGHAVLWLVQALELDKPDRIILYIGDDVTDEDAFQALRRRDGGVGIRVGLPDSGTDAVYYLRDCDEVRQFLQSLLSMLQDDIMEE